MEVINPFNESFGAADVAKAAGTRKKFEQDAVILMFPRRRSTMIISTTTSLEVDE
jgi:hypothetical protein